MIPIAKGKFSQPRQPQRDDSLLFQSGSPGPQEAPYDPSMEETRVLTSEFLPLQDMTPEVPQESVSFEEAQFLEETEQPVVYNTEEPVYAAPVFPEEEYGYEEEPVYARKKRSGSKARTRKILLVSILVVSALLIGAIGAGVMLFVNANKDDGLILNNVTVAGVNIGGMTPEQASEAIHRATDMSFTVEPMVIHLPDTILELSPKDTGAKLDVAAAVEAAYNYGRSGTAEENKKARADSLISNHTIALLPYLNLNLEYIRGTLDEYGESFNSDYEDSSWELEGEMPELAGDKFDEKAVPQTLILNPGKPGRYVDITKVYNAVLDAYSMNHFEVKVDMTEKETTPEALDLEEIFEEICSEAVDASMDMETFEVTLEVYGYTFDLEKAQELLSQTEYGNTLGIPMEYIVPEVLSADLSEKLFRDVLAATETPHTDDANRNTNLKLACQAINGLVLMPGDTFDYNKVLGERTTEKGYKPAGALSAGTATTEVGGGICQVSSTLYYACLLSDMEIVTRRSHSLPSSYMPMKGIDATVSWGGPEFRFKNNTNYPVRIEAEVADRHVKIRLVGTDEKDYYIKMEVKVVEILNPATVTEEYTAAEAAAKGYKNGQVKQEGVTGYTVYSYKCKYDKETDKLISKEYEATSNYVKKDKIVIVVLPEETEPPTTPPTTPPTDPAPTDPAPTEPAPTTPPPADTPTEPDADTISNPDPTEGGENP